MRLCEERLESRADTDASPVKIDTLEGLANDLQAAWCAPSTTMRTRQHIVRILIEDIIADLDETSGEIVLRIHWRGGQHSELRTRKPKSGEHRRRAPEGAHAVIRSMAGKWPDEQIAASLNRMGLRTGQDQSWNARRVRSFRDNHEIRAYRSAQKDGIWLTMYEAAEKSGVSSHAIRRLIASGVLPATQVVPDAPWQIRASDLESDEVRRAIVNRPRRGEHPCRSTSDPNIPMFPGFSRGGAE